MSTIPAVYAAISAVTEALAKTGITKDRNNQQQGYKFRGVDDIYNALAPLLAAHKLVILPRCVSREMIERQTKSGGALFYTTLCIEFDFVSAVDGSKHTIVTYGEAMDSADKSTNKAMSAAMKYACLMAFTIPTEGDNDADAVTHEVAPAKARSAPQKPAQPPPPPAAPPSADPAADWTNKLLARMETITTEEAMRELMTGKIDDIPVPSGRAKIKKNRPDLEALIADAGTAMLARIGRGLAGEPVDDDLMPPGHERMEG